MSCAGFDAADLGASDRAVVARASIAAIARRKRSAVCVVNAVVLAGKGSFTKTVDADLCFDGAVCVAVAFCAAA